MNLDELLKVNSVRCVKTKVDEDVVEDSDTVAGEV